MELPQDLVLHQKQNVLKHHKQLVRRALLTLTVVLILVLDRRQTKIAVHHLMSDRQLDVFSVVLAVLVQNVMQMPGLRLENPLMVVNRLDA